MNFKLALLFLSFQVNLFAQEVLTGKVVRVADGDTITLLDSANNQIRVRLFGIDCPEKGQDFSNAATKFTAELVFSDIVHVDVRDIDRYGRIVGVVFNSDSINVNLALLKAGLAWHYKYFDNTIKFADAELEAQKNKLGLWIQPNAIAPWKYRRRK